LQATTGLTTLARRGHVIGGVQGTYDRYQYAAEKRQAFEALAADRPYPEPPEQCHSNERRCAMIRLFGAIRLVPRLAFLRPLSPTPRCEYTDLLPGMVEALAISTSAAILDGELVRIDPRGAAHFYRLMAQMRTSDPGENQLMFLASICYWMALHAHSVASPS
jgi:hypothetical protein